MRSRRYQSRRIGGKEKIGAAVMIGLLLVGGWMVRQLRQAETIFLESGAERWGEALLAECADAGMQAVDGSLIRIEKDESGALTLISVDPAALHTLRTEIIRQAEQQMEQPQTVKIPLGTVLASEWFSGRGPGIPFCYQPVGSISLVCTSALESGGINQTAYRVVLSMQMEVRAVTSFAQVKVTVPYEVVAAETMIVGEVPFS
jgi:sporulation protein YunB